MEGIPRRPQPSWPAVRTGGPAPGAGQGAATPLDLLLNQLRCRRLIVTGIAADDCMLFSAMDADLRGCPVWVPVDCTVWIEPDWPHPPWR